jgi:hypothetical protein
LFFNGCSGSVFPLAWRSVLAAATGYSITRSLREAPAMAKAVRAALAEQPSSAAAVRFVWEALWTQERRRQVRPQPAPSQRSALVALLRCTGRVLPHGEGVACPDEHGSAAAAELPTRLLSSAAGHPLPGDPCANWL